MPKTHSNPTEIFDSIKLGIDAHARWFYLARQIDEATPQSEQKMDLEGLLHFVARQQQQAKGSTPATRPAFGYHLHRRLIEMGVTNYVVQPQDWDELGKNVASRSRVHRNHRFSRRPTALKAPRKPLGVRGHSRNPSANSKFTKHGLRRIT